MKAPDKIQFELEPTGVVYEALYALAAELNRQQAVIEAARREVEKWKRGESVVPVSIVDAVEALDALEKKS